MTKCIDTHIHIWDLERAEYAWLKNDTSILNQTYTIDQLDPYISKANIAQGILVQASNNLDDTNLMLEVAAKTDWIAGVVGWLPLTNPKETLKILTEKYLDNQYFKGCRHLIHNEPDPQWLLQDSVMESLKILASYQIPYDIVGINTDHLQTTIKVAEKLPELKMILDHLNQPPIASKEKFGQWGDLIKEISQHQNVYAKISGLGTAAGNGYHWTKYDLLPYVMYALNCFGSDRCVCGGDWPVSLLAGTYEKTWRTYQEIITEELTKEEQEKVLCKNAILLYHLSHSS